MKLLAIGRLREGADARDIAGLARAEMRSLWQLYRDGVVREAYSPGGVSRSAAAVSGWSAISS
jgi:hypothetical protein